MGSRTPVRGYRDGRQPDDGRPLPRRRNSRSRRHPLSKQSFPYLDLSARCVRPLRSARPSIRALDGPVKKSRRPSVSPPGGLPTPSYQLPIDRNTYGLSSRVRSLLQALLCNPAGAPSHEGFAFPETSENAVYLRTKKGRYTRTGPKEEKRSTIQFAGNQPLTTSFAAFSPAICPKTKQSRTAFPPTRFVPWIPPVISPAA